MLPFDLSLNIVEVHVVIVQKHPAVGGLFHFVPARMEVPGQQPLNSPSNSHVSALSADDSVSVSDTGPSPPLSTHSWNVEQRHQPSLSIDTSNVAARSKSEAFDLGEYDAELLRAQLLAKPFPKPEDGGDALQCLEPYQLGGTQVTLLHCWASLLAHLDVNIHTERLASAR